MTATTYTVEKNFGWNNPVTAKVASVLRSFGMTIQRLKSNSITHKLTVKLSTGDICYLTGASGAGKSVLMRNLYEAVNDDSKIWLTDIPLPSDKTCVDCIDGDYLTVLKTLSCAGLNDVFCVLNAPAVLSEGQRYRYRLAKAIASGAKYIFADEFCSSLDRITAAVIACNIRKYSNDGDVTFVLASAHDDLLSDLRPEVIVIKRLCGDSEVIYKKGA